jgi:hypothetical protein
MVAGARSMGRCEEPSHTTTGTEYSGIWKNNLKNIAIMNFSGDLHPTTLE